jgi:hypothetical protein
MSPLPTHTHENVHDALGFKLVAMNISNGNATVTIDAGNADSVWFA